jgi:hypothetical protein
LEVVYQLLRRSLEGCSRAMNVISIPKLSFSCFSSKDRPQTLTGSYQIKWMLDSVHLEDCPNLDTR